MIVVWHNDVESNIKVIFISFFQLLFYNPLLCFVSFSPKSFFSFFLYNLNKELRCNWKFGESFKIKWQNDTKEIILYLLSWYKSAYCILTFCTSIFLFLFSFLYRNEDADELVLVAVLCEDYIWKPIQYTGQRHLEKRK